MIQKTDCCSPPKLGALWGYIRVLPLEHQATASSYTYIIKLYL